MLPWSFSEEAAAEKHMAQLQHNMWVVASRAAGALGDHGRWKIGAAADRRMLESREAIEHRFSAS
jgi:hypothetical protein